MVRFIKREQPTQALEEIRFIKPLTTVAQVPVASSKPKVELDTHADNYVVGNNSLVIDNQNKSVNVYSYDPKDG